MFELINIPEYRQQADLEAKNKAINLAQSYATYYISSQINLDSNLIAIFNDPIKRKKAYIKQCESLVWPVLFQSPLAPAFFDRKEFYKAFENWDANSYVLIFCNELKRLMV